MQIGTEDYIELSDYQSLPNMPTYWMTMTINYIDTMKV